MSWLGKYARNLFFAASLALPACSYYPTILDASSESNYAQYSVKQGLAPLSGERAKARIVIESKDLNGETWTVNADGSDFKKILSDAHNIEMSPNGKYIAFMNDGYCEISDLDGAILYSMATKHATSFPVKALEMAASLIWPIYEFPEERIRWSDDSNRVGFASREDNKYYEYDLQSKRVTESEVDLSESMLNKCKETLGATWLAEEDYTVNFHDEKNPNVPVVSPDLKKIAYCSQNKDSFRIGDQPPFYGGSFGGAKDCYLYTIGTDGKNKVQVAKIFNLHSPDVLDIDWISNEEIVLNGGARAYGAVYYYVIDYVNVKTKKVTEINTGLSDMDNIKLSPDRKALIVRSDMYPHCPDSEKNAPKTFLIDTAELPSGVVHPKKIDTDENFVQWNKSGTSYILLKGRRGFVTCDDIVHEGYDDPSFIIRDKNGSEYKFLDYKELTKHTIRGTRFEW